ncbi:MAG: Acyltransferase [Marmoricola sp.]|nr:Acyltransferase [Marmoricola sp.]
MTATRPGPDTRLDAITGLRGLAVLVVVAGDLTLLTERIWPGSAADAGRVYGHVRIATGLGVDLLFALSGFVLAHACVLGLANPSLVGTVRFLRNRAARVVPVSLLTTGAALLLVLDEPQGSPAILDRHVTQGWNVAMNAGMLATVPHATAINPVAWTVSLGFAAFAIFPVLAFVLARINSSQIAFGLAGLWLGAGTTLLTLAYADRSGFLDYDLPWARAAIMFPAGALLYVGWRALPTARTGRRWDAAAVVALLGTIATCVLLPGPSYHPYSIVALACVPFLVIAAAGAAGPVRSLLTNPLLVWGGRVAYSVYMSHYLVIVIVVRYVLPDHLLVFGTVVHVEIVAATLIAVYATGAACFHLFEDPLRLVLRGRQKSPSTTTSVVNAMSRELVEG